jgi:carnitine O-acetyltransferase
MIESNGDYRDEMFLEEYIGGPLYENQKRMRRLPIPSIHETLERLLPTALPLAKTSEDKISLQEACQIFPEQAELLQERLMARQKGEMADSSWLQVWWNQASQIKSVVAMEE